jgi:hypothetical protein
MGVMPIKQLSSSCKAQNQLVVADSSSQTPPLVKEAISKHIKWTWNKKNYGHVSQQGPKLRTVLAKSSSKLLLCSLCKSPAQFSALHSTQEISEFSAEKVNES